MPQDKPPASVDRYKHEEFVVALPYAAAVSARARNEFGIACDPQDSRKLNLTLLRPDGLGQSAETLRREALKRMTQKTGDRILDIVHAPNQAGASPLDNLMFCLRYDFAASCAGWVPPMGKNRLAQNVTGMPHIDGGGIGNPDPASRPAPPRKADLRRGAGIRVGILDTQLFPHADLAGRYLASRVDLLGAQDSYSRFAGHATFVAGRIVHQAPAAELDMRWTLDDEHASTTIWDLVHRMVDFRDSGVKILNLSLGCYTSDGQPPMVLARAIQLLAPDIVIVASAGNHGDPKENVRAGQAGLRPEAAFWPAAFDDVVAVGADRGPSGELAAFSPRLPWVTFTAKGEKVVSTYLEGKVKIPGNGAGLTQFDGYANWSGTSFAAATVTGELAALTKPGKPAWPAVAELKERARRSPEGPVRIASL